MQRGERGGSTGLAKDKNEKTVEEGEFLTALVRGVLCFIVAQGGNHDCGPVVYVRELLSLCRVDKASYAWPYHFLHVAVVAVRGLLGEPLHSHGFDVVNERQPWLWTVGVRLRSRRFLLSIILIDHTVTLPVFFAPKMPSCT